LTTPGSPEDAPPVSGRIVIVGAGLAGGTAAATLRKEGFEGSVTLVGAEPHLPYERPGLSKGYLRGESSFDDLLVRPGSFFDDRGIDLRSPASAVAVDPGRKVVRLEDAHELPYDRLLLATGCRNRRPPIPGLELDGVHSLRTVDDCDRFRADLRAGARVVVAGMSFVGSEVAASLRQLGYDVTAIVSGRCPLERAVGDDVGLAVAAVHRDHGVRLVEADRAATFEGDGRVQEVVTRDGRRIPCDVVLVAVGVKPDLEAIEGSGIASDDGVLVDEWCRTSVRDVYACGDVARFTHPLFGQPLRIEHWQHARRHGRAAARSMLGRGEPYLEVPWFWSDQFDHEIQYAGHHDPGDKIFGRREGSVVEAYVLRDGVLRAAVALDGGPRVHEAARMIGAGAPWDAVEGGASGASSP
jgi:3-phenylpropionate/trans-cinnamate dioxygenase ferredoxin reductase subunit